MIHVTDVANLDNHAVAIHTIFGFNVDGNGVANGTAGALNCKITQI